jgi:hypothetical protein
MQHREHHCELLVNDTTRAAHVPMYQGRLGVAQSMQRNQAAELSCHLHCDKLQQHYGNPVEVRSVEPLPVRWVHR